jgi:hypothetical protein
VGSRAATSEGKKTGGSSTSSFSWTYFFFILDLLLSLQICFFSFGFAFFSISGGWRKGQEVAGYWASIVSSQLC